MTSLIVIDTSVVVAVIKAEPEAQRLVEIMAANPCRMSAFSVFEAESVIGKLGGPLAVPDVRKLLGALRVEIVPFDDRLAVLATEARLRFGKGVHPARLNLGDCAAYALAASLDVPLLYKGDDFALTDIVSAI